MEGCDVGPGAGSVVKPGDLHRMMSHDRGYGSETSSIPSTSLTTHSNSACVALRTGFWTKSIFSFSAQVSAGPRIQSVIGAPGRIGPARFQHLCHGGSTLISSWSIGQGARCCATRCVRGRVSETKRIQKPMGCGCVPCRDHDHVPYHNPGHGREGRSCHGRIGLAIGGTGHLENVNGRAL